MVDKPRKGAGLDRLLAIWSRRKWLAIVAFATPLTVGLSFAAFIPRIYRATATVLVDGQQLPEKFVAPTVTSALETRLQTISQEVLSRSRLEELILRFGLYRELRKQVSSEEVIERMRSDIELELLKAQLDELALSDAPTAPPPQVADSFAVRLEQLRLELAQLRGRYFDTHPDVVQKKAEIAELTRGPGTAPDKGAPGPGRSV